MLSELWRPLAILGTFLVIVIIVLVLLFSGGGDDEPYVTPEVATPTSTIAAEELDPDAKPPNPDSEPVAGKDLEVGDCLSDATATTTLVTTFDKIDCDKAHDGEVFTIIKLPDAAKYPGKKVVTGKGQRGCRARLRRQATNKAFRDPRLGYKFVYPTQQSWAQDDREISCLATFRKSRKTRLAQRSAAS
ncbi:MAG TPA: septum formation family protein [Solirubrobacteraceae bacterium]|nr:septum formation family protein [Solirubrobacteraceae bacterium]